MMDGSCADLDLSPILLHLAQFCCGNPGNAITDIVSTTDREKRGYSALNSCQLSIETFVCLVDRVTPFNATAKLPIERFISCTFHAPPQKPISAAAELFIETLCLDDFRGLGISVDSETYSKSKERGYRMVHTHSRRPFSFPWTWRVVPIIPQCKKKGVAELFMLAIDSRFLTISSIESSSFSLQILALFPFGSEARDNSWAWHLPDAWS